VAGRCREETESNANEKPIKQPLKQKTKKSEKSLNFFEKRACQNKLSLIY
jgi:hypothetical protein